MLDILDAPVPYLVGIDAEYLQKVPVKHRPNDALLVDLDRDVLHMGGLDIPKVPPRDAEKLLLALEEAGGSAYLVPNSGIKGCIMSGTEVSMLVPNGERPHYAYMTTMKALNAESLGRQDIFETTDLAYGGAVSSSTATISGFGTEHGQMSTSTDDKFLKEKKTVKMLGIKPLKKPKFMRNKRADILCNSDTAKSHGHLLDMGGVAPISIDGIRLAFLRFTVTLFTEYEDLISSGPSHRLFNDTTSKKLMSDLRLESGSTLFLQNVVETQYFQHFLEERKANPETPEVRFFEESIIAKVNRSKKATLANGGKKRPTPFLNDETWKVTRTYTPPPPSNLGLPDNNDTYCYGIFPSLDPSRFGRIRPPMSWRQNNSTRFKFAKKNSKVTKTERDIMKLALKPLLSVPHNLMAAAARSAKDLDSALMAVSGASGIRGKSDEPSSTDKWKESVTEKRTVNTLSKADMIMINARRKNVILLDCIIKMQAVCRGVLTRSSSENAKYSDGLRTKLKRFHKDVGLEKARRKTAEKHQRLLSEKAAVIQGIARMYVAQSRKRESIAAILMIQRCHRMTSQRKIWLRMKHAAVVIQKNIKGRRTRMTYAEVYGLILHLQARVRGKCVRNKIRFIMSEKMGLYRTQIFVLWAYVHLPLAVRTKLWPDFRSNNSFLRMHLAEAELRRLWIMAGYGEKVNKEKARDKVAQCSEAVGLDSSVYCRCKRCVDWINETMAHQPPSSAVTDSFKAEEVERLQAYERLSSFSSDRALSKTYQQFNIPANEKMKKVALAKKLWTNIGQVESSVSAMMLLFPELAHSLGINFLPPSAKGQRRFPNAGKLQVPSLDQNMWNEISVEGNVKKHVQEVAILYMTRVPAAWKKISQSERREVSGYPKSYQQAIQEVYMTATWREARRILIMRYLDGRYVHKANPNVEVVLSEGFGKGLIYPSLQQTPSDFKNPYNDSPASTFDEKKMD